MRTIFSALSVALALALVAAPLGAGEISGVQYLIEGAWNLGKGQSFTVGLNPAKNFESDNLEERAICTGNYAEGQTVSAAKPFRVPCSKQGVVILMKTSVVSCFFHDFIEKPELGGHCFFLSTKDGTSWGGAVVGIRKVLAKEAHRTGN